MKNQIQIAKLDLDAFEKTIQLTEGGAKAIKGGVIVEDIVGF